jgi:Family of unknown function (DUF5995)
MPLATTIDEVLSELEKIIADAQSAGDRVGFFAALYHKVTAGVKEGIAKGSFQDGPRMAGLDVIFANRYLAALNAWRGGQPAAGSQPPTQSWKIALDSTKRSGLLVLQHLLLGINAHINLDLGIAAVETMQGQDIEAIHTDFDTINTIIGSLTYQVLHEIDRISPLLSLIGLQGNNTNSFLIQFSIGNARDGAWCFAEELSKQTGDAYAACIMARDTDIATLAGDLAHTNGFLRFTLWIVHLFEWKNPGKIIAELYGYKKSVMHAASFRKPTN